MALGEQDTQRIQRVPSGVERKIAASVAVKSLCDVVIGLLRNSLDAGAKTIKIVANSGPGYCFFEDDGLGIPSREFQEDGRLGLPSSSSKLEQPQAYGRYGNFLADLGAVSSVLIVSKASSDSSASSLMLKNAVVCHRHVPAPCHQAISLQNVLSGTIIVVSNLFTSLPVRIKEQSLREEASSRKDWDLLREKVVALLLAWHRPLRITVFDQYLGSCFKFDSRKITVMKHGELDLDLTRSVLRQLSGPNLGSKESWTPIATSNSKFKLIGAISLDFAPTRALQFISLDNEPIQNDEAHAVLFNIMNKIFEESRFGIMEADLCRENEVERQGNGRRYKKDGFTGARLRKGRKGVDKWPMFYLRYETRTYNETAKGHHLGRPLELSKEDTVDMVNLLGASATKWLHYQDFRPRKWNVINALKSPNNRDERRNRETQQSEPIVAFPLMYLMTGCTLDQSATKKCSNFASFEGHQVDHVDARSSTKVEDRPNVLRLRTRMKCSDSSWLSTSHAMENMRPGSMRPGSNQDVSAKSCSTCCMDGDNVHIPCLVEGPSEAQARCEQGATTNGVSFFGPFYEKASAHRSVSKKQDNAMDEIVPVFDSPTGMSYSLNRRTGMMRLDETRLTDSKPGVLQLRKAFQGCNQRSTNMKESGMNTSSIPSCWVENIRIQWQNPVFRPSENGIRSVAMRQSEILRASDHQVSTCGVTTLKPVDKLFATNVQNIRAISQVDGKWIVSKVESASAVILVLIDQHAASERIIFERLLQELCVPYIARSTKTCEELTSHIGYTPSIHTVGLPRPIELVLEPGEKVLCQSQAPYLARWGIMFNTHERSRQTTMLQVEIFALPPILIARYSNEPDRLREFFRAILYAGQERNSVFKSLASPTEDDSLGKGATEHLWLRQISDCPEVIIAAVKSQACRSAIMFNDSLTRVECQNLVEELAQCAIPLQCAHGRKAIVPLVGWT